MKKSAKNIVVDSSDSSGSSLKEELILFGIFLVIAVAFFVLLANKKPDIAKFGLSEIFYSLIFAFLMTSFLLWTKSMSIKQAHLGFGTGIAGLIILEYGFWLSKFKGPYSTAFMSLGGIIVLGYLAWNFWKFRKEDRYAEEEYD